MGSRALESGQFAGIRSHDVAGWNPAAPAHPRDRSDGRQPPMTTAKAAPRKTRNARPAENGGRASARVIRKYPNRRLYDTVESRYVTLADIRRLVIEGVDFVVLDRKSQQDITRSILLQVIAEQEGGGESLMSRDFLSQVIRTYGSGLQDFVGRYLDESLQLFSTRAARAARPLQERRRYRPRRDRQPPWRRSNYQRWRALQEEVFGRLTRPFARDDKRLSGRRTDLRPARRVPSARRRCAC